MLRCSVHPRGGRAGAGAGLRTGGAAAAVLRGRLVARCQHLARTPAGTEYKIQYTEFCCLMNNTFRIWLEKGCVNKNETKKYKITLNTKSMHII